MAAAATRPARLSMLSAMALMPLSASMGALAQQADAFDACARETDSATRLACFDHALAARHRAAAAPAASTLAAPTPRAPPSLAPVPAAGTAGGSAPASPGAADPTRAVNSDIGLDARQLSRERRARGEPEPQPPAPIVARVVRVIPRQPLIAAFEHRGTRREGLLFANVDPRGNPDLRMLHAGKALTCGEKWILSQFIRRHPVR
jgi:hypothetical protein